MGGVGFVFERVVADLRWGVEEGKSSSSNGFVLIFSCPFVRLLLFRGNDSRTNDLLIMQQNAECSRLPYYCCYLIS